MLLIAFGTRPEWLKVKPVIDELVNQKFLFETLFTGQHRDLLNVVRADVSLHIPPTHRVDRLTNVLSSVMVAASKLFQDFDYKYVMVQGDTTSALGVALAAFHNGIKVIHLEAGLRTFDLQNPFPEEANRLMISKIASIHLCPTPSNELNLVSEQVGGEKWIVGNTVLDNLLPFKDLCEYTNKVLVTLHRRENHDSIDVWFEQINRIAAAYPDYEFILPIHPNPNVMKHRDILTHVKVIPPLNHEDLLNILVKCKFVVTDSGGLQEESSFFQKKTIVCRKETERPEALGQTSTLCPSPAHLESLIKETMIDFEVKDSICPFGDGFSAKKIVKILEKTKIV